MSPNESNEWSLNIKVPKKRTRWRSNANGIVYGGIGILVSEWLKLCQPHSTRDATQKKGEEYQSPFPDKGSKAETWRRKNFAQVGSTFIAAKSDVQLVGYNMAPIHQSHNIWTLNLFSSPYHTSCLFMHEFVLKVNDNYASSSVCNKKIKIYKGECMPSYIEKGCVSKDSLIVRYHIPWY